MGGKRTVWTLREADFTLDQYRRLCQTLRDCGYETCTVRRYLADASVRTRKRACIMRHDVDRRPARALAMARLESRFGVRATYYFRVGRLVKCPSLIREIEAMGHEIGFHYENLSKARGDMARAVKSFECDLNILRHYGRVETVCMHGRPLSRWDNRLLWPHLDAARLGLKGEPYCSIDYNRVLYLTDTGRSWGGEGRSNLRDTVEGLPAPRVRTTPELMEFLADNETPVCLTTHPERWTSGAADWLGVLLKDGMVNRVKRLVRLARRETKTHG